MLAKTKKENRCRGNIKMKVREYADGTIITEDEFEEYDNSVPYYDDYREFEIEDWEMEDFLTGI